MLREIQVARFLKFDMLEGKLPLKKLLEMLSRRRALIFVTWLGNGPEIFLEERSRAITWPIWSHWTPGHEQWVVWLEAFQLSNKWWGSIIVVGPCLLQHGVLSEMQWLIWLEVLWNLQAMPIQRSSEFFSFSLAWYNLLCWLAWLPW